LIEVKNKTLTVLHSSLTASTSGSTRKAADLLEAAFASRIDVAVGPHAELGAGPPQARSSHAAAPSRVASARSRRLPGARSPRPAAPGSSWFGRLPARPAVGQRPAGRPQFHRQRPGRHTTAQGFGATTLEGTALQPHRVLLHPERLGDARAGPPRRLSSGLGLPRFYGSCSFCVDYAARTMQRFRRSRPARP
jgi:hypothetical protein